MTQNGEAAFGRNLSKVISIAVVVVVVVVVIYLELCVSSGRIFLRD